MRVLITLCLCVVTVAAQKNQDSIYARGLQACLEKELSSYGHFTSRDLRNVVVAHDFYITTNLPEKLGDISIRYLTEAELVDEYKKLSKDEKGRGVPFVKIFPISDKDNKLFFAYNNYWFSYDEKGGFFTKKTQIFSRALEGGCKAEIGFAANENKFSIVGVELWGV